MNIEINSMTQYNKCMHSYGKGSKTREKTRKKCGLLSKKLKFNFGTEKKYN